MKINVEFLTRPSLIQELALSTVGKIASQGKPFTPELFKKYLISEHSPIRAVMLKISMLDIPYYSSVHFARHVHTLHYVSSNRPDRAKKARKVDDTVNHIMVLNCQALIDMMRKRLCCGKVDATTGKIAYLIKEFMILSTDPYLFTLGSILKPNGEYRGFCPEFKSCGACKP